MLRRTSSGRLPLVVASVPSRATALAAVAKTGWGGVLMGPAVVAVPDPLCTAEGALSALAVQSAVGSPAAYVNAIVDALRPLGVTEVPMPCTPERVWRAIEAARANAASTSAANTGAASANGGAA